MPEYTLIAAVAALVVVAGEVWWFRTGIFSNPVYWIAMGICLVFMVLTNGWLTKLSAPIVNYHPSAITGLRLPFDIPIEDYLFGFTLLTLTILLWRKQEPAVT